MMFQRSIRRRGLLTPVPITIGGTNILPSSDNHSSATWSNPTGWASGTSDIIRGTSAETWTEHSGSSSRSTYTTDGFSTSTGQHLMEFYYKQKPGSNSARKLVIEVANSPATWDRGVDLDVDELGNAGISAWGSGFTNDNIIVTRIYTDWYYVRWKFTVNTTTILVWLGHWNDSNQVNYTGDGSSGWIIDNQRLYKI